MTLWFTSDDHFGHYNIIKYANRPFTTTAEMDEALIQGWNERVKPEDHIYNLGDVTMFRDNQGYGLRILEKLNGHKRLIMGNHDHYHVKHYLKYFEKVMAMNVIDNMRFTHIPVHPLSMGRVKANVHGHTHEKADFPSVVWCPDDGKPVVRPYINISVERTNYHPISLEDIKVRVKEAIESYEETI